MAFRSLKLFRILQSASVIRHNVMSTSIALPDEAKLTKRKEYKTDKSVVYLEDPDTFGTLAGRSKIQIDNFNLEDGGDIKEQKFLENVPLQSQKLTIKQYADLIKQYLEHKRLKEAIDILEVRMLTQDRVKPENYIYNILIGACAEVGYTKKAFKLFNDMKRRALKPTGDTYTCLFHACANSPWQLDGLKKAERLRELMKEKGIEPNITNYNAMIKAFGRCGDVSTAFKIVDEMTANKIKIRVHTFNHLLHACIADKNTGLRHALVVWRKMLKLREKPNIYTFNLILKCVKECNLGSKEDIEELMTIIQQHTLLQIEVKKPQVLQVTSNENSSRKDQNLTHITPDDLDETESKNQSNIRIQKNDKENQALISNTESKELSVPDNVTIQFIDNLAKPEAKETRTVPNLLSKVINLQQVMSLQEVHSPQDKFAVIGGQEDFLKEMESYSVQPDIKIFTQMLPLLEDTREAEDKLLEAMKSAGIRADIDFYNMLIKKRCLRSDYDGAFNVKELIAKDGKKRHPLNKKHKLKVNIMTYGVLAMACKTKENAEKLLNEMKEEEIKVNIEILGTLLRQGTSHNNFKYVQYIMEVVKEENVKVNDIFIKHLEAFNDKCAHIVQEVNEHGQHKCPKWFPFVYKDFSKNYSKWLKEVNAEEALVPEHPWNQFNQNYPETVQRQNFEIVEPKRFYKRNRKYVQYTPRL